MKTLYIFLLSAVISVFFFNGCLRKYPDFDDKYNKAFGKKSVYTKEDFMEFVSYYNKQYLPKRKKEVSLDKIPTFPLEYIEKNGNYKNSSKYDFLTGAFIGWYDFYLGQIGTLIDAREAMIDGYRYGSGEAQKALK